MQHERSETWRIGKDVSQETHERFKDEHGHLYVVVHYNNGKPSVQVWDKAMWDQIRRTVFSTRTPSSFEEHFDYQHTMLLSSGFEAQTVAAVTMNALWRGFFLEYPTLESFRDAEEATKADYLRKIGDMTTKMAADELLSKTPEGTSRGAFLFHLYLVAVARNDAAMVDRIAEALEPFNKVAHDAMTAANRG